MTANSDPLAKVSGDTRQQSELRLGDEVCLKKMKENVERHRDWCWHIWK